jgi:hypothetical protein
MVHGLIERLNELVEVFFVQEDLVSVVAFIRESLPTFGDGQIIIITSGRPYIKEISPAFTCAYTFTVHAVHAFVVVFV